MAEQIDSAPLPGTDLGLEMQIASLNSSDLGTRMAAESALKSGDRDTINTLIGLLADTSQPEEARWRAAIILGDLKASAATAALLTALDDKSWEIRHSAVYALGHLCASAGFDALQHEAMRALNEEQIPYVAGLGLMQIDAERAHAVLDAVRPDDMAVYAVARSVFAAVASRRL